MKSKVIEKPEMVSSLEALERIILLKKDNTMSINLGEFPIQFKALKPLLIHSWISDGGNIIGLKVASLDELNMDFKDRTFKEMKDKDFIEILNEEKDKF